MIRLTERPLLPFGPLKAAGQLSTRRVDRKSLNEGRFPNVPAAAECPMTGRIADEQGVPRQPALPPLKRPCRERRVVATAELWARYPIGFEDSMFRVDLNNPI